MNTNQKLKSQKISNIIKKIVVITFLSIMSLAIIIPFYWMINTSFKTSEEILKVPPTLYPNEFTGENYHIAFIGKRKFNIKKYKKDIENFNKEIKNAKSNYETKNNLFLPHKEKYEANTELVNNVRVPKKDVFNNEFITLIDNPNYKLYLENNEKIVIKEKEKETLNNEIDELNGKLETYQAEYEKENNNKELKIAHIKKYYDYSLLKAKINLLKNDLIANGTPDDENELLKNNNYKELSEKIKKLEEGILEIKPKKTLDEIKNHAEYLGYKNLKEEINAKKQAKQANINELKTLKEFRDNNDNIKKYEEINNDVELKLKDFSAFKDEFKEIFKTQKEAANAKEKYDSLNLQLEIAQNKLKEEEKSEPDTFTIALINTLIVGIASTILGTLMSIIGAFALSRLNFKGRDIVFSLMLTTMMIPGEMMVITNYITVSKLGWTTVGSELFKGATYLSMIVPFMVSVFHIYLLRQNFRQIPDELYYAAKIDGTSDFKYLWKVMVPLSKSSIITITILKLMGTWNSYIWPNLVGGNKYKLITVWLRTAFVDTDLGRTVVEKQMAATVIVLIPLLLVFIFLRKYIMRGVARGGTKG